MLEQKEDQRAKDHHAEAFQLQFLPSVDGVLIPVRIFPSSGNKSPVIMFHGLQSHSGWFLDSAIMLAKSGFPVFSFDRRGSGLSNEPRGECKRYEQILDDALEVVSFSLRQSGLKKVHLLGQCFGALPALLFALKYEALCHSVVLAAPAVFTKVRPEIVSSVASVFQRFVGKEAQIPLPFSPEQLTDVSQRLHFIKRDPFALTHTDLQTYRETFRMRRFINLHSKSFVLPLLVLLAGKDEINNNEKTRLFVKSVSSSKKQIIEYSEAKHILEYSKESERFFYDLHNWLFAVEAASENTLQTQNRSELSV